MANTISAEDVLQALAVEEFPESKRRNVKLRGDGRPVWGMCLGITHHWTKGPWVSLATKEHARLAALLCAYARQELPGVTFTSVQVNKDYRAALHVDKNNLGPSWIIGLGDYAGGRLWIDDGSRAGHSVDIRGQWFQFDGNRPHCVLPFRGRRYTLVFFTYSHRRMQVPISPYSRWRLEALGFPLPSEADTPLARESVSCHDVRLLLAAARTAFAHFRTQVAARGGVGNVCVQVRLPPGRVQHVGLSPLAPLRHLAEAIAARLAGGPGRVQLMLGSLRLLPGDTLQGLGLDASDVIDVQLIAEDTAPCSLAGRAQVPGAGEGSAEAAGAAGEAAAACGDRPQERDSTAGGRGAAEGQNSEATCLKRRFCDLGA